MISLLLAVAVIADDPQAGVRQSSIVIMSDNPAAAKSEEEAGYSDAIVAGDFIYLSGVVASLRPGETSYEAAYTRAFEQIGSRLSRLGATWDDVVEMTTFHTDIAAQSPPFIAVKRRYVRPPYPAWTAIGVSRLVPPFGVTEIKVVAFRGHRLPAAATSSK